ncbi:hypothetical protein IJD44_00970 [bacterium]|nr:hypothetical protein [bacterium]
MPTFTAEVLNFIERRFKKDCNWTNGNCYYFALILCERFSKLRMYYLPITGHFVAGAQDEFFDFNGVYKPKDEEALLLDDIKHTDFIWYNRLMRDCWA